MTCTIQVYSNRLVIIYKKNQRDVCCDTHEEIVETNCEGEEVEVKCDCVLYFEHSTFNLVPFLLNDQRKDIMDNIINSLINSRPFSTFLESKYKIFLSLRVLNCK